MQPHRCRYWLNPKKDNEEEFKLQVNEVCSLYKLAQELLARKIHLVSTDEMTGIQALERLNSKKLVLPGSVEKQEFEYIRHGTQTLIANWHVARGKVISPTIQATRTEQDFVEQIPCNCCYRTISWLDFCLRSVKYSSFRVIGQICRS